MGSIGREEKTPHPGPLPAARGEGVGSADHPLPDMSDRRSGITLIEVVVVLGVIAFLLCMMIPAIIASRGAADRVSCLNHMKQLVLALHNHEVQRLVLPPGVVNPTGPIRNIAEEQHISWTVPLLPFMEQGGLSGAIVEGSSAYDPINAKASGTRMRTLVCPSDRQGNRTIARTTAVSSYAGCHHDVEAPIDADNHGVFFLNSHICHDDLFDGSAYTIFIGEKPIEDSDLGWMSGTRATLRNTGHRPNDPSLFKAREAGGPAAPRDEFYVGGFGSYHPGGTHFGFGDGSVRFIAQTIDPGVYRLLGHRDDGEPISSAAFPNSLGAPTK